MCSRGGTSLVITGAVDFVENSAIGQKSDAEATNGGGALMISGSFVSLQGICTLRRNRLEAI